MNAAFTWEIHAVKVVNVQFNPIGGDVVKLQVTENNAEQLAKQLEEMAAAVRAVAGGFSVGTRPTPQLEATNELGHPRCMFLCWEGGQTVQCALDAAHDGLHDPHGPFRVSEWRSDGSPRCQYVWEQNVMYPPGPRQCILPSDHSGEHGF